MLGCANEFCFLDFSIQGGNLFAEGATLFGVLCFGELVGVNLQPRKFRGCMVNLVCFFGGKITLASGLFRGRGRFRLLRGRGRFRGGRFRAGSFGSNLLGSLSSARNVFHSVTHFRLASDV